MYYYIIYDKGDGECGLYGFSQSGIGAAEYADMAFAGKGWIIKRLDSNYFVALAEARKVWENRGN